MYTIVILRKRIDIEGREFCCFPFLMDNAVLPEQVDIMFLEGFILVNKVCFLTCEKFFDIVTLVLDVDKSIGNS